MDSALDALRTHNMSLTKASVTFGIPSTTLWQRAHRMGIDTPKKEGPTKSWSEDSLNSALDALRTGQISANKASKAYGIPSSTLYKIARKEGIRLAAPFNAAPTTWTQDDLERALEAIRTGNTSVQKASTEFGIPTGECRWTRINLINLTDVCTAFQVHYMDAVNEKALNCPGRIQHLGLKMQWPMHWNPCGRSNLFGVKFCWFFCQRMKFLLFRVGEMSINQAAIHYNLPYSSLYGRFKRGKYDISGLETLSTSQMDQSPDNSVSLLKDRSQVCNAILNISNWNFSSNIVQVQVHNNHNSNNRNNCNNNSKHNNLNK